MSQPTKSAATPNKPNPIREKILIGAILYLFGSNQELKIRAEGAEEREKAANRRYDSHMANDVAAANRVAFRQMVRSDTMFVPGRDTVFSFPVQLPDSTK